MWVYSFQPPATAGTWWPFVRHQTLRGAVRYWRLLKRGDDKGVIYCVGELEFSQALGGRYTVDERQRRLRLRDGSRNQYRNYLYAFICNEYSRRIKVTSHKTREAAVAKYGDLRRLYKGTPQTDYDLTIVNGLDQLIDTLGEAYEFDHNTMIATLKPGY